jgi:replication factor C subunit 2/4
MLFYGPPGTGKTSTILARAKQLYGPTMFGSRVLELNASDERGIAIVREKVKDFARQHLTNPPSGDYTQRYPCPPYKIIVLDEADSMTQDAQSALRRTMETYSRITRFCLVCNYVTRIIDPLASRCSKFRFKSLDSSRAEERLRHIADAEGVRLEDGATAALVKCAEGDLRKAITFLQSAARLANAEALKAKNGEDGMDIDGGGTAVTAKSVQEIAGTIPEPVINGLWNAMQPKPNGASVYPGVAKCVEDLVADGWSGGQTVSQVRATAMLLSFPISLPY